MGEIVRKPPSHPNINAFEVAVKYAQDVLSGAIVSGKLLKLAAKRFNRDLKFGHERGLFFDKDAAQRVVDFFGFLKHSKGEWGGKTFVLEPWQVFILANIFGWMRADGTRRFRKVYIEVARKNGKTTFMAGIGLYLLLMDNEPGAEIYSAATKKDQATIVFDEAFRMRAKSEFLSSRIDAARNNLNVLSTFSKFEPLSSDDNTLDGLNAHGLLIDELHAHPNRDLYDVLYESTKARRQPMAVAITTAGKNINSFCYSEREYGERILVGNVGAKESDHFFAFIACIDKKDNWEDPACWPKANPSLGVSVKLESLREDANEAKVNPTKLNSFLRKHMNVWTSSDVRWMPPDKWAACNIAGPLKDFMELRRGAMLKLAGRVAFAGLDLSSKIDLTAYVLVFPPLPPKKERRALPQTPEDRRRGLPMQYEDVEVAPGDPNWYVIPWYFMPRENIAERVKKDRVDYAVWAREGFIHETPGNAIDHATIRAAVNEIRGRFQVKDIGFDSWNAQQLSNELKADGHTLTEVRQGFKTMSEPMKELMALVLSKKLEHFGNPVLAWNAGNVQAEFDPADNIKPDKERSKEKIDGIVAMIMAMHRIVSAPVQGESVYSKRGIIFL